jgi:hypothetical protein
VNPWSSAEPGRESAERELFARRARALDPAEVPSLATVLRAAEVRREAHAAGGARGRAFMAMALAAACMMAALTRLPHPQAGIEPRASIAAELDASSPSELVAASVQEPAAGDTCASQDERLALEEQQCVVPTPLYTPRRRSPGRPSFTPATRTSRARSRRSRRPPRLTR